MTSVIGIGVLLFQKRFHAGIVDGSVRLTFRLWDKPHVKTGGRYRVHPIGVVEVDTVEHVTLSVITDDDARAGGFVSRDELLAYMTPVAKVMLEATTRVFRVGFKHGGDGDRVPLALEDDLSADDVAAIEERLAKFDGPSKWTKKVLALIDAHPRTAASQLARKLGEETAPFKANVVKLKKLGLTQSFEVGYEISPRGRSFLSLRGGSKKKAQRRSNS